MILAEILGNQIRSNGRIKGVRVGNSEKKIMQCADDAEQKFLSQMMNL